MKSSNEWERMEEARAAVSTALGGRLPDCKVGVVLGSGLSALGDAIEGPRVVAYDQIPTMPVPRVSGHQGHLVFGTLSGVGVVCLSGRAHLYEGHPPSDVVFGVRLLHALGVKAVIVTNAAGGIAPECSPGTLMIIRDHLNLTGQSPLIGPNDERLGPRFVDMTVAYDQGLRESAHQAAASLGIGLAEGVYAGLLGPTYETPAEIRMLEYLGASAVGMSTVLETIALRHLGVRVLGISCITNHAAGKSPGLLSHDEVKSTADRVGGEFCRLVSDVIRRIDENG